MQFMKQILVCMLLIFLLMSTLVTKMLETALRILFTHFLLLKRVSHSACDHTIQQLPLSSHPQREKEINSTKEESALRLTKKMEKAGTRRLKGPDYKGQKGGNLKCGSYWGL